jgi:signal transduction histidine kinase
MITILLFFCTCNLSAQVVRLPEKLRDIITDSCFICSPSPVNPASNAPGEQACHISFHNAHLLLEEGFTDSAYHLLTRICAEPGCAGARGLQVAGFLRAKILYFKNLLQTALPLYLNLLSNKGLPPLLLGNACCNVAEIYLERGEAAEALRYYRQWKQLYMGVADSSTIRNTFSNIGLCYLHLGRYSQAEHYFSMSIELAIQQGDSSLLATAYQNIANQYYNQYRDREAIRYFGKALRYAEMTGNIETQKNIYSSLATIEEERKNWKQALAYHKRFLLLHDSIYNRDNIWAMAEKEKKLLLREKEYSLRLLHQENLLNMAELGRQRWQRNAFVILATSLFLLAAWVFIAYRQKKKQNGVIATQREQLHRLNATKDQLFSVVAHDLRSPLHTLQLALHRLKAALAVPDTLLASAVVVQLETISSRTASFLNNLLYWSLSQTGQLHLCRDRLEINRLLEQVLYDYEPIALEHGVALVNELPPALDVLGDMNTMRIALRNLMDNAIRYAGRPGKVLVSGGETTHHCFIAVQNDGESIDQAIIDSLYDAGNKRVSSGSGVRGTGIGLWLVKTMTEKNGGQLKIQRLPHGTLITIYLPKNESDGKVTITDC